MARWPYILGGAVVAAGVVVGVRHALASGGGRRLPAADTGSDGSYAPQSAPAARQRLVVAVGDSITAGYLPKLKALLPAGEVDGEGWTGKQVSYIASHAGPYLAKGPTVVVVGGGINDLASGRTALKTMETLAGLYVQARQGGAKVVALPPHPCSKNAACARIGAEREKLNQMIRAARGASAGPDVVVDVEDMPGSLLGGDGLHPTAEGQRWLAQKVAAVL